MSNPYLTPQNHPRVKIGVLKGSFKKKVDCLIDTGFSGGLALPESYQAQLKLRPLAYQELELADGSWVVFAVYEIKIKYKQLIRTISLIFTKSEDALLGIEFLEGLKLVLDLKKKKISLTPGKLVFAESKQRLIGVAFLPK